MRFILKSLPLSLIAVLLLAACGGDSTPTPTPAPTATPTIAPLATVTPTPAPVSDPTIDGSKVGIDINALLFIAEVQAALPALTSLTTNETDFFAMAQNADPAQVAGLDAFKGLVFQSSDGAGLTLTIIDFESADLADAYLISSTDGLDPSTVMGSDGSFQGQGDGVTVVIAKRDDVGVSINISGLPETGAELEATIGLAALALSRLD